MKMTKALALLMAIAMVVVCFNVPAICDDGDDHPWDNDNDGFGGDHSSKIVPVNDSTFIISEPVANPLEGNVIGIDPSLILNLSYIINYRIIPEIDLD